MLFGLIRLVVVAGVVGVLHKNGIRFAYSIGFILAFSVTAAASVCLGQNYAQSLIPSVQDGIGISNPIAYWIIGESLWTQEQFRLFFERSMLLLLCLLTAIPFVIYMEARQIRKSEPVK
ncbi:hypothetical protein [Paenibacillus sp. y28]|uniref:hypothetical protein n=1 Tax=Paenibacillus sp. y28 TaxID=3129110 RepID=UPI0030172EAE